MTEREEAVRSFCIHVKEKLSDVLKRFPDFKGTICSRVREIVDEVELSPDKTVAGASSSVDEAQEGTPTTNQPALDSAAEPAPATSDQRTSAPPEQPSAHSQQGYTSTAWAPDTSGPSTSDSAAGVPPTALDPVSDIRERRIHNSPQSIGWQYEAKSVPTLWPTVDEFNNFDGLIEKAKELGATSSGVCKVILPDGINPDFSLDKLDVSAQKARIYIPTVQPNGTVRLDFEDDVAMPSEERDNDYEQLTDDAAIQDMNDRLKEKDGLSQAHYCVDMPCATTEERLALGLSKTSPLHPLKGNLLAHTKEEIPGVCTPYAYHSRRSGALFALHKDDHNTYAVNLMRQGQKLWFLVPADAAESLEKALKDSDRSWYRGPCSQFLRHRPTFIPPEILKAWSIPFITVRQCSGEALIVYPGVYHEGFSLGLHFSEAVNYAGEDWNFGGYKDCNKNCPKGFITKDMLAIQDFSVLDAGIRACSQTRDERPLRSRQSQPIVSTVPKLDATPTKKRKRPTERPEPNSIRKRKASAERPVPNSTPTKRSEQIVRYSARRDKLPLQIPHGTVKPEDLYNEIVECSVDSTHETRWLLVRLFYGIGSPNALFQLRETYRTLRQKQHRAIPTRKDTVADTVRCLQQLDSEELVTDISRRFFGVRLAKKKEEYQQRITEDKSKKSRARPDPKLAGTAATLAINDIITEGWPDAKGDRKQERRRVHNMLTRGRNWTIIAESLPEGVLALMPPYDEFQYKTSEVENLPSELFKAFVDLLVKYRGSFLQKMGDMVNQSLIDLMENTEGPRYILEDMEDEVLKRELFDSATLIGYCEPI